MRSKKQIRRTKSVRQAELSYEESARIWGLNILLELDLARELALEPPLKDTRFRLMLKAFGMDALLGTVDEISVSHNSQASFGENEHESPRNILVREFSRLLNQYRRSIKKHRHSQHDTALANLARLAKITDLNDVEVLLMKFALALDYIPWMDYLADRLAIRSQTELTMALQKILALRGHAISEAIRPEGLLARSRLLIWQHGKSFISASLKDCCKKLDNLAESLSMEQRCSMDIFKSYFHTVSDPVLSRTDYSGIKSDYLVIRNYLHEAIKGGDTGVNLLIYGEPGVGKTQLARVLAKELGLTAYEVACANCREEAMNGRERLNAYRLSQQVLKRTPPALVIFDEAEDIFSCQTPSLFAEESRPFMLTKAAINRMLEENPVPTIWLSNSIRLIDPAFMRRFSYALELRVGSQTERARAMRKQLKGLPVSPEFVDRLAINEKLAPAIVGNAARIVRRLDMADKSEVERTVQHIVENTLTAMKLPNRLLGAPDSPLKYDMASSNPDINIGQLVAGLADQPHARLCLYGPPGTGKTAFGKHVAQRLDKSLLVKRASDLLSMWVGGSEQNIAAMFRNAEREHAVLLLDEADSFLRERSSARASWEVTQVNELLTQMESFESLFIASTNLVDALDVASLRRFDFKIKFGYMTHAQATNMFVSILRIREPEAMPMEIRNRLLRLDTLTPGDFAVVARKARVFGAALNAERLIQGLEVECRMKVRDCGKPIGFTADLH